MSLIIGTDPEPMTVLLEDASDFEGELVRTAGDWPSGASLKLDFGLTQWTATIAGAVASFYQAVPGSGWEQAAGAAVSLVYSETVGSDTYTQVIAKGRVTRK